MKTAPNVELMGLKRKLDDERAVWGGQFEDSTLWKFSNGASDTIVCLSHDAIAAMFDIYTQLTGKTWLLASVKDSTGARDDCEGCKMGHPIVNGYHEHGPSGIRLKCTHRCGADGDCSRCEERRNTSGES